MEFLSFSCSAPPSILQICSRIPLPEPELKFPTLLKRSRLDLISVVKTAPELSSSQSNLLAYLESSFYRGRRKSPLLNSSHFSFFISKRTPILKILTSHLSRCHENQFQSQVIAISPKDPITIPPDYVKRLVSLSVRASSVRLTSNFYVVLPLVLSSAVTTHPAAAEISVSAEQISCKVNIESVLLSIDDFFNRYPFFVATVSFIWLVVIPLIEEYFKKYKFISAFDGYRKLNDDPGAQLLDIRNKQSLQYLGSPNLRTMMKATVQIEFTEGKEENFVKEVLKNFRDPGNTVVCVIDK